MVRYPEPSKRIEASFTKSRNRVKVWRSMRPASKLRNSCQVLLMESHISMVSAVRTARALARAASKQLRIDDELAGENDRNSVTVFSFAFSCTALKAARHPAVATADSHSLVADP